MDTQYGFTIDVVIEGNTRKEALAVLAGVMEKGKNEGLLMFWDEASDLEM